MKTLAIVQARMGSSRLPGKVLLDLGGTTVLARVVDRLRRSTLVDEIVVATSASERDDAVIAECERLQVGSFRGSEYDVLDRYHWCAELHDAEIVVRITADCPLIDPELVDQTIHAFVNKRCDYASNALFATYPRGLDVEVLTTYALAHAWNEARSVHQREHVTPFLYEHPELFRLVSVEAESDYSHHRWTLDTPEDLQFLRSIYARFDGRSFFGWREVLELVQREPQLAQMNAHVIQKAVHA